jgi:hypothetical protein
MATMLRLTVARQVDLVQVTLPLCQSGEDIITLLRVVMRQAFHQIQLHQVLLQLMSVIQTVQRCTLNIVQMVDLLGKQVQAVVQLH